MTSTMPPRTKTNLDSVLRQLRDQGFEPLLTVETLENIIGTGIRSKSLALAIAAVQLALEEKPIPLRGLLYRIVSKGLLPSTDDQHYNRMKRLIKPLRRAGI